MPVPAPGSQDHHKSQQVVTEKLALIPAFPASASYPGEPRPFCCALVVSSSSQNFAKCIFSYKCSRNTTRQYLIFPPSRQ